MSLTNLFNFHYLKENLKKSKAVVLLCIFLIPIINGIIYLMSAVRGSTIIPDMSDLMPLLTLGMYVIPVILSLSLFDFAYKRNSSDFIVSMPISKKQIFLTNTLGGIVILLLMNIVNFIFLLIISLLFNNIFIDYRMLFDIFIIYSITYIFVFVSSNIGVSLSGNKITTVVVTMLILFLVPFINTFISTNEFDSNSSDRMDTIKCEREECTPKNYTCYDEECELNRKNGVYEVILPEEIDSSYTLPYGFIGTFLLGNSSHSDNANSILIKEAVLSILYIILGCFLFKRKKFEVVRTSFKSEKVHIFVRSLTTIPILCIYYVILRNSSLDVSNLLVFALLLVLIITYLIIYDLITVKRITNFGKMIASLIIVSLLIVITGGLSSTKSAFVGVDDIKEITIRNYGIDYSDIDVKDRELIDYVVSIYLDNGFDGNPASNFSIILKTKKNNYNISITVTKEQLDYINSKIEKSDSYINHLNNIKKRNVFAVTTGTRELCIKGNSRLYDMIINKYRNSNIYSDNSDPVFKAKLYMYDDYEVKFINLDVSDDKDIVNEMVKLYNLEFSKYLKEKSNFIYSYNVMNVEEEEYVNDFDQNLLKKFLIDHVDDEVDINKEYRYITLNTYNGSYVFITNATLEFDSLNRSMGDENE